ncbi:MAG: hypothetical protein ACRYGG_18705 [Janthinobacterium lividum]
MENLNLNELIDYVDPKFYKFINENTDLYEEGKRYNLILGSGYTDNPQIHQLNNNVTYPYDPELNAFVKKISLFGQDRFAFIGNPLMADTIDTVATVAIETRPDEAMSKTAQHVNSIPKLSREDLDIVLKYIRDIASATEIQQIINTSNTFHIPFLTNFSSETNITTEN